MSQLSVERVPGDTDIAADFGVRIPPRRRLIRYCVDWGEQRPQLSGALGRGLLDRLTELDWVRRSGGSRAIKVTEAGWAGLEQTFGISDQQAPAGAGSGSRG